MKIALIIACIGHIICGITDCMLAYMKNGRFEFSDVKDDKKMQKVFEGASLKQIELAMLVGVFALFLAAFGYIGVSRMTWEKSPAAGIVMLCVRPHWGASLIKTRTFNLKLIYSNIWEII